MRLFFQIFLACLAIATIGTSNPARAQDKTGKNLLLALEDSLQDVIKQTEPSVACILVSRSDIYRNFFKDAPPADQPGKLGAFDPTDQPVPILNNNQFRRGGRGMFRGEPIDRIGARRYDLSYTGYMPEAYGSGIVVDGERLLVLTNYHVVHDATKVYVRFPGGKGSYADIYAADPQRDLAVLSLIDKSVKPLKPVKFGNGGTAKKGQIVVAIANPYSAGFRDGSPSASWGIVSNIQRRAAATTLEPAGSQREEGQVATYTIGAFIRTDAQILAGSSGGALVNLNGEVIGLISSRAGITGLEGTGGYATPMDDDTKRIINELKKGKEVEHGFLGIQPDLDNKHGEGAVVGGITPGGPAQLAGITVRDCIVAVNGTPVRDFDDLVLTVSSQLAGSEARLEIRDHKPPIVTVKLGKAYVPGFIASNRPESIRGMRVDYTSVYILKRAKEAVQSPSFPASGVFVSELAPGSPAEKDGVSLNVIITAVNGVPVASPEEFYHEAAKVAASKPLNLTIVNNEWQRATSTITVH
jgi:serine protease Do